MQFQQKLNHFNLYQKIQELLREQIIYQQIKPGTRLVEEDIARELGVSRTPVREALTALVQRGLVESHPRRGMYVAKLNRIDVSEIYEIREALEGLLAFQVASLIPNDTIENLKQMHQSAEIAFKNGNLAHCIEVDTKLHDTILANASNCRLIQLLEGIHDQILIFRIWESKRPERVELSLKEHRSIIEALAMREADLARSNMIKHIERVRQGLLEKYPFDPNVEEQMEEESIVENRVP